MFSRTTIAVLLIILAIVGLAYVDDLEKKGKSPFGPIPKTVPELQSKIAEQLPLGQGSQNEEQLGSEATAEEAEKAQDFDSETLPSEEEAESTTGSASNTSSETAQSQGNSTAAKPQVYFCPEDSCASKLIEKINSAKTSLHVAIFSFTLDEIRDALVEAKKKGVDVKVVFDKGQAGNKYSEDEALAEAGIPIKYRGFSGYMHNKFIVYDDSFVSTGSFNYSKNANEKNDENLIFIFDREIAGNYEKEFDELWETGKATPN